MRRILSATAFLLTLSGCGSAPDNADPAILSRASNATGACAAEMPDVDATGQALEAKGIEYLRRDGRYNVYTAYDRRLIVGLAPPYHSTNLNSTSADDIGDRGVCFVFINGMTADEARVIIQPWVAISNGKPLDGENPDAPMRWKGTFRNGPVVLGIIDDYDIGFMPGAAGWVSGAAIIAASR